jgi:translation initiation factor 1 (eIF-1/SUI1)
MSRETGKVRLDADSSQLSQGLFGGIDIVASTQAKPQTESRGRVLKSTENKAKSKRVTLRREKSGRGGKVVTLVTDLPASCNATWRAGFLKRAKQKLGCGGKLQADAIELQGDCRSNLAQLLQEEGFKAVIAGG